jgi:16S rRNA (cytosine967-C5)-methyltransferase
MDKGRALDDALEQTFTAPVCLGMEPRDRAFVRLIAVTVLRRCGSLRAVVETFIEKPLPADTGLLWPILLAASAQLLLLDTPPHAAISLAVDQTRADHNARRFDRFANAVLRKVSTQGRERLATLDTVALDTPAWLLAHWTAAYGTELARAIAAANLTEAALDLSVKADAPRWAEALGGIVLASGSVRLKGRGRIEDMPGYQDGAWWVQDAAAALPGRLLGNIAGLDVADLCAAPGGKTSELAAAGANVTAVDVSDRRLLRVKTNLARIGLTADLVAADILTWNPGRTFDAVLLDAPCTATGTIRRHPDILRLKQQQDVAKLASLQADLLPAAAKLVRPGGLLVYCVCSLEPAEGIEQIERFLAAHAEFTREPIIASDVGGWSEVITPAGDLRTLPTHLRTDDPELSGLDGFYAARMRRT